MGSPGPQSLNDSDHQLLRDNIGIHRPGTSKSHLRISRGAKGFSGVSVVMALSHFRCEEPKERIKSFRRAATEQALLSRLDVNLKPVSSPSEFSPRRLWVFLTLLSELTFPSHVSQGVAEHKTCNGSLGAEGEGGAVIKSTVTPFTLAFIVSYFNNNCWTKSTPVHCSTPFLFNNLPTFPSTDLRQSSYMASLHL